VRPEAPDQLSEPERRCGGDQLGLLPAARVYGWVGYDESVVVSDVVVSLFELELDDCVATTLDVKRRPRLDRFDMDSPPSREGAIARRDPTRVGALLTERLRACRA
jgi:hypothetical protein